MPQLIVDGSIPLQYGSNIAHTSQNRVADWYTSPYFKLSLNGDVLNEFGYSLYANTSADKYFKFSDNDSASATAGFELKKRFDSIEFGAFYERNYFYDGIYETEFNTANDFGVFLRYRYVSADGTWRIRPSMAFTTRTNDLFSVQRNLFSFKVDMERKINDRWSVFLIPRLRVYDFVNRDTGRNDMVASVAAGLRYDISNDVSITSGVGYESRTSGVAGRNYNSMLVSVSLDFSYVLGRLDMAPTRIERSR